MVTANPVAACRSRRSKPVDYTADLYVKSVAKTPADTRHSKKRARRNGKASKEVNSDSSDRVNSSKRTTSSPQIISQRSGGDQSKRTSKPGQHRRAQKSSSPDHAPASEPLPTRRKSENKSGTSIRVATRASGPVHEQRKRKLSPSGGSMRKRRRERSDSPPEQEPDENSGPQGDAPAPQQQNHQIEAARNVLHEKPVGGSKSNQLVPVYVQPGEQTTQHGVPEHASVPLATAAKDRDTAFISTIFDDQPAQPAPVSTGVQKVTVLGSMINKELQRSLIGMTEQRDAALEQIAKLQAEKEEQKEELLKDKDAVEAAAKLQLKELSAQVSEYVERDATAVERVKENYRHLYSKFQQVRGESREGIKEVFDEMWEHVEEHKEATQKLNSAWKAEAEFQKSLFRSCGADKALERLRSLEEENGLLRAQTLNEAQQHLLQAQEITELRHMVDLLKAGRTASVDAACSAVPETCEVGTQTRFSAATVLNAPQRFRMSPVSTAHARRREENLDITCLAGAFVPEGVDVRSLDTELLRAALEQPVCTGEEKVEAGIQASDKDESVSPVNGVVHGDAAMDLFALRSHRPTPEPAPAQTPRLLPAVRHSSTVQKAQVLSPPAMPAEAQVDPIAESPADHLAEASGRGSNAAAERSEEHVTPQQHDDVARDSERPVRSDPGPVRKKVQWGGMHVLRAHDKGVARPQSSAGELPGPSAVPSMEVEVGDDELPSMDNLGGSMSTDESNRGYDEPDLAAAAAEAGSVHLAGLGLTSSPVHEVAQMQDIHVAALKSPSSHGAADSVRTSNSLAALRGFRDEMLGMELRLSPCQTSQRCRDLKSGFCFTIKRCDDEGPGFEVDEDEADAELADLLTYVPDMKTCTERVKALMPKDFQEEFVFRAAHLHEMHRRLDRALEVINGKL